MNKVFVNFPFWEGDSTNMTLNLPFLALEVSDGARDSPYPHPLMNGHVRSVFLIRPRTKAVALDPKSARTAW